MNCCINTDLGGRSMCHHRSQSCPHQERRNYSWKKHYFPNKYYNRNRNGILILYLHFPLPARKVLSTRPDGLLFLNYRDCSDGRSAYCIASASLSVPGHYNQTNPRLIVFLFLSSCSPFPARRLHRHLSRISLKNKETRRNEDGIICRNYGSLDRFILF